MNREKVNEWLENTFSDYTKEEDRKESIFYLLKKLQDDQDKEISRLLTDINDAKNEIFRLNNQDKLAELEQVILNCYLAQGYQIGIGGWAFKVNISTFHKTKEIQIMFRQNLNSNLETIFRIDAKTTKEMFDKAIEFFNLWTSKILELQNDKRR